ncbi:MAG: TonB-dependent receptor plug domain-containing protein [Kiritimatiellae bacterium]|nr:TonB-dependent receptor plug domain-containing protein [Kiritimatiellia bacterium]
MQMMRWTLLCAVVLAALVSAVVADDGVIIVTATPFERNLLETPAAESASLEAATSVVGAEQILRQNAATLTEALTYAPGVHIETRGRKYKSFNSFRGQIYPYPTYSLGGIWQREFSELAYVLPASQIEQVDVLRSSGSLFAGLGDITGVINVTPRRYATPTTLIEAEGGTFNSWRLGAVSGNTTSNGWYTAGVNGSATDGPSGRNAAEHNHGGYVFGGAQISDRLYLEGRVFAVEGARELMTPDPEGPALNSLKNRREEYDPFNAFHLGGKAVLKESPSATLEVTAGYTSRDYHYTRREFKPAEADEDDREYTLQAVQALVFNEVNTLRLGAVYNRWVAPEGKRSYTGFRQDIESWGLTLADEHQFERVTLDAGLRVVTDYYNDFSGATFNINGASRDFKTVTDEWGDPLLTATLGAKLDLTRALNLYAHLAGGQRSPEPGALKADGTDLSKETRIMADAGIRIESKEKGALTAGAFYVLRNDAITKTDESGTDADGDTFYFSDNQDVVQYGVECEAKSAPIADIVSLFVNATLMSSRLTPAGESDSQDYREIPDFIGSAGLYSNLGRWDATLAAKYVSGYENNRFAQDKQYHDLGDFWALNATAGYTLGSEKNTRVYVAAANILDDEYSTVVGWSDPGLRLSVGARHMF